MNTEKYQKLINKILLGIGIIGVFSIGIFVGKITTAEPNDFRNDVTLATQTKDLNQFWGVWKLLNEKFPFKDKIPSDTERIYEYGRGIRLSIER